MNDIPPLSPPPVDHSRVELKDGDANDPGSDYINANIITVVNETMVNSLHPQHTHTDTHTHTNVSMHCGLPTMTIPEPLSTC